MFSIFNLVAILIHTEGILEVFYINNTFDFVRPPVRDFANYTKSDGTPQADIVTISGAYLSLDTEGIPFVNLSELSVTREDVKFLKSRGIVVLFSIFGSESVGWGCINPKFTWRVAWNLYNEVIEKWEADGIDIDDEGSTCHTNPHWFADLVWAIRGLFGSGHIIKKDLWDDYYIIPLIKNAIDFGSTMDYAITFEGLIQTYHYYINLGLLPRQILIGIQIGPETQAMPNMSTILRICHWVVDNESGGLSEFNFASDTCQFTDDPQLSCPFPSPRDHRFMIEMSKCLGRTNFPPSLESLFKVRRSRIL